MYISRKNSMKYSLKIVKNINIFKRHKYPSPNALNAKYLWTLSYILFFGVSLKYPLIKFKKTVCPKSVWMRHYLYHTKHTYTQSCSNFIKVCTCREWNHDRSYVLQVFVPSFNIFWQISSRPTEAQIFYRVLLDPKPKVLVLFTESLK